MESKRIFQITAGFFAIIAGIMTVILSLSVLVMLEYISESNAGLIIAAGVFQLAVGVLEIILGGLIFRRCNGFFKLFCGILLCITAGAGFICYLIFCIIAFDIFYFIALVFTAAALGFNIAALCVKGDVLREKSSPEPVEEKIGEGAFKLDNTATLKYRKNDQGGGRLTECLARLNTLKSKGLLSESEYTEIVRKAVLLVAGIDEN
jgi:hypothetical protein